MDSLGAFVFGCLPEPKLTMPNWTNVTATCDINQKINSDSLNREKLAANWLVFELLMNRLLSHHLMYQ